MRKSYVKIHYTPSLCGKGFEREGAAREYSMVLFQLISEKEMRVRGRQKKATTCLSGYRGMKLTYFIFRQA